MQSSKVGKYEVWYENAIEFGEIRKEIWTNHVYYLDEIEPKRIVDLGAHIGLASLYFSQIYPNSQITAYEPDPENFQLLKRNIEGNQISSIEAINAAVAPKAGEIILQAPIYADEWRSGVGIIEKGWRGILHTQPMKVSAVSVEEVLSERIDLLKIDTEGMEYEIIEGANLSKVENMILEVHPRKNKRLSEIERKLKLSGFHVERREDVSKYGNGLVMIYGRKSR